MKHFKLFVFICLTTFLSSCEPPYDGTAIIEIENEFLDNVGNPVANLPIIYTIGSGEFFSSFYSYVDTMNYLTNAQGKIRFSTFKPNEYLFVNYEGNALYVPIYSPLLDLDPKKVNKQRFYLLQYDETVDLNIQLQTTNLTKSVQNVSFTGIGNLNGFPSIINSSYNYRVRTNQTVTLFYTVYNTQTSTTTNFSQNIPITSSDLTYTINY